MKKFGGIILLAILVVLASCSYKKVTPTANVSEGQSVEVTQRDPENGVNASETQETVVENTTLSNPITSQENDPVQMKKALPQGKYISYSQNEIGKNEKTVVFFHATWCPSCRAADTGIKEGVVPEGVSILKADYDQETELKKKYGIVSQHTFVQVDADGNMIKKWIGGTSVTDIVSQLQ